MPKKVHQREVKKWVVCRVRVIRCGAPRQSRANGSHDTIDMGSDGNTPGNASSPALVYHVTKDDVQTRHLVVYNTGPAVGADEATLRRVFEAYGEVERVHCPNPAAARVLITFHEVRTRTQHLCSATACGALTARVRRVEKAAVMRTLSLLPITDVQRATQHNRLQQCVLPAHYLQIADYAKSKRKVLSCVPGPVTTAVLDLPYR